MAFLRGVRGLVLSLVLISGMVDHGRIVGGRASGPGPLVILSGGVLAKRATGAGAGAELLRLVVVVCPGGPLCAWWAFLGRWCG